MKTTKKNHFFLFFVFLIALLPFANADYVYMDEYGDSHLVIEPNFFSKYLSIGATTSSDSCSAKSGVTYWYTPPGGSKQCMRASSCKLKSFGCDCGIPSKVDASQCSTSSGGNPSQKPTLPVLPNPIKCEDTDGGDKPELGGKVTYGSDFNE